MIEELKNLIIWYKTLIKKDESLRDILFWLVVEEREKILNVEEEISNNAKSMNIQILSFANKLWIESQEAFFIIEDIISSDENSREKANNFIKEKLFEKISFI